MDTRYEIQQQTPNPPPPPPVPAGPSASPQLAAMNHTGESFLGSAPSLFQEQAPLMITPIIPVEAHLLTQPGTDGQVRQPEVVAGVY